MSQHGFIALPRDINVLLKGRKNIKDPEPVMVGDIALPDTPLAKKIQEFAKNELMEETYNHSMRVYYFGRAIQEQQFPNWDLSAETYFITALLHDIGTTVKNMAATKMSFEFYGGFLARELLVKHDVELAEAVAEAVIRHQDLGTSGKITSLGLLIQLATIFGMVRSRYCDLGIGMLMAREDNVGDHADLIHRGTIDDVVAAYPRKKWSSCFAATIREENRQKPWCHTTALGEEDFPNVVLGNKLMERYEVD